MGRLQLKSDRAVEETTEALAAARRTVEECEAALADGEVTPDEARRILARARMTLQEARESVRATEDAYYADRAADTIRRVGVESASHQRLHVLAMAGVMPVDAPDNMIRFPEAETNDAA